MNLESGNEEALLRKPVEREKRYTLAESLKPATKRELSFQLMIHVASIRVVLYSTKQCSRSGFGSCLVR